MKKLFIVSVVVLCLSFAGFTSVGGPETDILGVWKVKSMIGEDGVENAFPFDAKFEFLVDSVFYEYKNRPDGTGELVRGPIGKWRFENNHTVLSKQNKQGIWKPSNIDKLTVDSLVLSMGSGNKMLLLKEK